MKKVLLLLVFTIFSINASLAQSARKNEKAVIKTTLYCDHCKACETCGKNFQSTLYEINGLKMYELDEKNMTITVYYDGKKTDLKTIQAAISKMGYDADDVKADADSYNKLDNCCKKA